jgi:two-component system, LytTR family, response regulator
MLRALIIDDEAIACDVLRVLLEAHAEISIAGTAASVRQARPLLARDDYDIVFLDIQLRGGSGFELVPHVRSGAQIIFVTAHDEHALRAFEVNALDYLLKPVHPARLARSLQKVADVRSIRRPSKDEESAPLPRLRDDDTVFIKLDSGARFVALTSIGAILSCENYSEVLLAGGEKLLVRRSLKAWEDALPAPVFVRAHRQALVNLRRLVRIEDDGGDGPLLHLDGVKVPLRVSRREWAALRGLLPRDSGAVFRTE